MLTYPWTNFEIQKYYENEAKFNGVYSRNDLSKIKDAEYLTNLYEYQSIGTHWIALYSKDNNLTNFCSFGVDHIRKEIRKFIGNKDITTNIYRVQAYDSIMYWVYWFNFER